MAVSFFSYLGFPLAPNYLSEVKGLDVSQLGLLGSAHWLGSFALSLLIGRRKRCEVTQSATWLALHRAPEGKSAL
jgi:hypothetical protein